MVSVGLENVTLSFGERVVFKDVTFSVNEGDRLGIVGDNGVGKTSLLRVITGSYQADGKIYLNSGATISMLEQNVERLDGEEREILEYISDGTDAFPSKIRAYLCALGFPEADWHRPVSTLSGGQKTKLALGRLLICPSDILILDEPTNHLDFDALDWLADEIRTIKSTVIVVSHDRYFLDQIANKILDIEYGEARLFTGNYSSYVTQKEIDREIQRHHYENQQREIARMEEMITMYRRWNKEKSIKRAEQKEKDLARMDKIEAPNEEARGIRMHFTAGRPSGNDVLVLKSLGMAFPGKRLFAGLSDKILKGERVFIRGRNGTGKSTLMKILMGFAKQTEGDFTFGANVTIGYYDQENQNLTADKTVLDELWDIYGEKKQTEIRSALALFLFKGDDVQKKVSMLSGGERARLTLAKLILATNNVLLLDEPTNHLDIKSREALESALADYDGTLIAVSHDRYFVEKLAGRFIDISANDSGNNCSDNNANNGNNYSKNTKPSAATIAENNSCDSDVQISANKQSYLDQKERESQIRRMKTELQRAKDEIPKDEARILELDIECEKNAHDFVKLGEFYEEKTKLEDRLLYLYDRVETLERDLSGI